MENTKENFPDGFYFCSHFQALYRFGLKFDRKIENVPKKKTCVEKIQENSIQNSKNDKILNFNLNFSQNSMY